MPESTRRFDQQLVRGTLINAAGLLAKIVDPVVVLVVTWLFGPSAVGVYFIAIFLGELASSAVTGGFVDAATVFGSHHADGSRVDSAEHDALSQVLANAFVISLAVSVALVLLFFTTAPWLIETLYPDHPELVPGIRLLALSLPLAAVGKVSIAATKARMRMEYEAAINGFARPLVLLGLSIVAWWMATGLLGLMFAHVVAQFVIASLGVLALREHFDLKSILRAMYQLRLRRDVMAFAIPQGINLTLTRYIARVDVLMLAAFGVSADRVAWYATAALITGNVRQIRLVFSTAFAPIAARYHRAGEHAALSETMTRATRWILTVAVPITLGLVVFRNDLLRLFDASYNAETLFMVILLIAPLADCGVGLVSNVIVYTGHSGWNLFNSLFIGLLNTVLNLVLIPRAGLVGAAIATAVSALVVRSMQIVELWWLEQIWLRWRDVSVVYIGLFVGMGLLAIVWDPVGLAAVPRTMVGFGAVAGSLAVMTLTGHPELRRIIRKAGSPSSLRDRWGPFR